jgi:hypothetical protein
VRSRAPMGSRWCSGRAQGCGGVVVQAHELGGNGCGGDGSADALPVSWRRRAREWREWSLDDSRDTLQGAQQLAKAPGHARHVEDTWR